MAATTSSPRVWPTKQQSPTAVSSPIFRAARAKREAEELSAAQEVAAKISGLTVDLTLEVGQGGQGVRRHHQPEHSRCPDRSGRGSGPRAIELEKPIKSEGEHEVVIKVHPQVEATLKVIVKENA